MAHNAFGSPTACGAQTAVAMRRSAPATPRSRALVRTAAQYNQVRMVDDGRSRTGILGVTDQIRRRAALERRAAQPVAGGPARRPERLRRRHPDPLQRVDLIADATVRDHAARIGAREYRHTRFARGGEARAAAAVKIPHVTGVSRVLRGSV